MSLQFDLEEHDQGYIVDSYKGNSYKFYHKKLNWNNAQQACKNDSAVLALIKPSQKQVYFPESNNNLSLFFSSLPDWFQFFVDVLNDVKTKYNLSSHQAWVGYFNVTWNVSDLTPNLMNFKPTQVKIRRSGEHPNKDNDEKNCLALRFSDQLEHPNLIDEECGHSYVFVCQKPGNKYFQ